MRRHKSVLLLLWSVVIVLSCAIGLGFGAVQLYRSLSLEPALAVKGSALDMQLDSVVSKGGSLVALKSLSPATRKLDASEFMESKVDWEGPHRLVKACRLASSFLADPGRHVDVTKVDWTAEDFALTTDRFDFSWFFDLRRFDFWDVSRSQAYQCALQRGASPLDLLAPRYVALVRWAKLRLVHGLNKKGLGAAIFDVRSLGSLLLTTETAAGISAGLRIFELESSLAKFLRERKAVARLPSKWRPLPLGVLASAQEVLLDLSGGLHFPASPEQVGKSMAAAGHVPFVLCGAIGSSLPRVLVARTELSLFYKSFFDYFEKTLGHLSPRCAQKHLRELWQQNELNLGVDRSLVITLFLHIPFLQRTWAERQYASLPLVSPSILGRPGM